MDTTTSSNYICQLKQGKPALSVSHTWAVSLVSGCDRKGGTQGIIVSLSNNPCLNSLIPAAFPMGYCGTVSGESLSVNGTRV